MILQAIPRKKVDRRVANAINLIRGDFLGSRDPAHIHRWSSAGVAARRALPKCEAICKTTGLRCRLLPIAGSNCCNWHTKGRAKDASNRLRAAEALHIVENRSSDGLLFRRAVKTLAFIARRNHHKLWQHDPRIPGSTLELDDYTEGKVIAWLKDRHRIDLDRPAPNAVEPPTPRCIDRLRWAAYRVIRRGHATPDEFLHRADLRVASALRDDLRFWKRLERLDAFDAP